MKCLHPFYNAKSQLTFNCGQCINCRINHTSMWALRCLYELYDWSSAAFVTLTYNDEFLPVDNSLKPKHLQDFFKRLRFDLDLEKRKCKFFACGEYGDSEKKYWSPEAKKPHGRPHYHAIIFGLDPHSDHDRKLISDNWRLCDEFMFSKYKKEQAIDEVNQEDISYVTGYCQKKLNGELAKENYGVAVRPFQRVSHGLGLNFALKNQDRLVNNGFTFLKNGKRIGVPRYFREKFGLSNADLLNKTDKSSCRYYFEEEQNALLELFNRDMKRKGFSLENDYMREFRFKQWIENYQFTLAEQVKKSFEERRRKYSKL